MSGSLVRSLVLTLPLALAACTGMRGAAFEEDAAAWEQKLTPGMTMEEVRAVIGSPPDDEAHFTRMNEVVLGWFYYEFGDRRMFFNAHFDDATGRLKRTSRSVDPAWIQSTSGGRRGFF